MTTLRSPQRFLGRALGYFLRYFEILGTFFRHGFADFVHQLDARIYRRIRGRRKKNKSSQTHRRGTPAQHFRWALEELGPTFIKIGQLLSHRPDILSMEMIRELECLRSSAPSFPFKDAQKLIVEELGEPLHKIFSSFDEQPVASASIAQVHRAFLLDGTMVAVKVQRPGIRQIVEKDLAILRDLARLAERRVPSLAPFRPQKIIREFERALLEELDFRNEANNIENFGKNFAQDQTLVLLQLYRRYCSQRILVMDFIEGISVGDQKALRSSGADLSLIVRRGANAIFRQIFEHRFFHADPHGSNLLVLPDNKLAFLDFGMMGTILPSQRRFLIDLLHGLVSSDASRTVRAILSWSGYRDPAEIHQLTMDMEGLIEQYLNRPFEQINLSKFIALCFSLIRRYHIEIPSNFYLLGKSLMVIENITVTLDPQFSFLKVAGPYVRKMFLSELRPLYFGQQAFGLMGDVLQLLRKLPGESIDFLNLLNGGKLQFEIKNRGIDSLHSTLPSIVFQLSMAILAASLIVGSSILAWSQIPPLFFGISLAALIGFAISGLVAIILLLKNFKHRRSWKT